MAESAIVAIWAMTAMEATVDAQAVTSTAKATHAGPAVGILIGLLLSIRSTQVNLFVTQIQ